MSEISQKQLEANQENAKKGGVKTPEGKAVSKHNSIKHGLLSKEVLLEGEDEKSLVELGRRIRADIEPVGELEMLLADRVITNMWRLRRLLEVEREHLSYQREEELTSDWNLEYLTEKQRGRKAIREMLVNEDTDTLLRYESAIERSIYKALHELERLQASRNGEMVSPPIAIDIDVVGEKTDGFVS